MHLLASVFQSVYQTAVVGGFGSPNNPVLQKDVLLKVQQIRVGVVLIKDQYKGMYDTGVFFGGLDEQANQIPVPRARWAGLV